MAVSGNSYVSTVNSAGNGEFYQPTTTAVGAANGSTYRVTGMHYGDMEDIHELQMVMGTTMMIRGVRRGDGVSEHPSAEVYSLVFHCIYCETCTSEYSKRLPVAF